MSSKFCIGLLTFTVAIGARAQPDIEIGDLDPPALDGLKGAMGCVAYHLDDSCEYVLGYVVNGSETVIVLKEFQRRLESGRAQSLIIDLVKVPTEFAGSLKSIDCRYDGHAYGDPMVQPFVAAMSATGDHGDWVGPADWVVIVDFEKNELVSGDPQLVECWIDKLG